jgi:hypothetical protein
MGMVDTLEKYNSASHFLFASTDPNVVVLEPLKVKRMT